jgi:hypothetical protein
LAAAGVFEMVQSFHRSIYEPSFTRETPETLLLLHNAIQLLRHRPFCASDLTDYGRVCSDIGKVVYTFSGNLDGLEAVAGVTVSQSSASVLVTSGGDCIDRSYGR